MLSQLHGDDFLNDILGIGVASEQQPYLEPYHTPTHGNRDGDETCLPTTRATNVSGARGGEGGADSCHPMYIKPLLIGSVPETSSGSGANVAGGVSARRRGEA